MGTITVDTATGALTSSSWYVEGEGGLHTKETRVCHKILLHGVCGSLLESCAVGATVYRVAADVA